MILNENDTVYDLENNLPLNGILVFYPDNSCWNWLIWSELDREEYHYLDGKPHGVARSYYKNGKTRDITTYQNGVKHGLETRFKEDGNIYHQMMWDTGKLNGPYISYMPYRDKISSIISFEDGKLNGNYIDFFENGAIKNLYVFENDSLIYKTCFDKELFQVPCD